MIDPYFNDPALSNSRLSNFKRQIEPVDQFDSYNAFRMGSLIDAAITEPHRLNHFHYTLDDEDYSYSREDFKQANIARKAFLADPFCIPLYKQSTFQHKVFAPILIEWEGQQIQIPARCKWDGFMKAANWGWELKYLTASTEQQFDESIDLFDYDRAAYFYMTISNADRYAIIAISKTKPGLLFKRFVIKGDKFWKRGRDKCNKLAFQYWMLKM